jgi:hypothetical protein
VTEGRAAFDRLVAVEPNGAEQILTSIEQLLI